MPLNSPFCLQKSKIDRFENLRLRIDRFDRTSRTCANDATAIHFFTNTFNILLFRSQFGLKCAIHDDQYSSSSTEIGNWKVPF